LDIEAWELNGSYLLEIGISTWDVEQKEQKTRHLIIEENRERRNGKYCDDNRDNFSFGKSEIIPKEQAVQIVKEMFQDISLWVFHNASAELNFLNHLGITVPTTAVVDTQCISYLLPERNGLKIGLTDLLKELNIPSLFMHNAGNDSHFTLLSLLALVDLFREQ